MPTSLQGTSVMAGLEVMHRCVTRSWQHKLLKVITLNPFNRKPNSEMSCCPGRLLLSSGDLRAYWRGPFVSSVLTWVFNVWQRLLWGIIGYTLQEVNSLKKNLENPVGLNSGVSEWKRAEGLVATGEPGAIVAIVYDMWFTLHKYTVYIF